MNTFIEEIKKEYYEACNNQIVETPDEQIDWWIKKLQDQQEQIKKMIESYRTSWDNEMVNTVDWKDANDWTISNILNNPLLSNTNTTE